MYVAVISNYSVILMKRIVCHNGIKIINLNQAGWSSGITC